MRAAPRPHFLQERGPHGLGSRPGRLHDSRRFAIRKPQHLQEHVLKLDCPWAFGKRLSQFVLLIAEANRLLEILAGDGGFLFLL